MARWPGKTLEEVVAILEGRLAEAHRASNGARSVAALRDEQTTRIVTFIREEAGNDLAWTALARQHFNWIADRVAREFGSDA